MLKTTNYKIKDNGLELPIAFAGISEIQISGIKGFAKISVHTSRENVTLVREGKLKPLEEVLLTFRADYNEHIPEAIYKLAKSQVKLQRLNDETGKVETVIDDYPFFGWQDDIV